MGPTEFTSLVECPDFYCGNCSKELVERRDGNSGQNEPGYGVRSVLYLHLCAQYLEVPVDHHVYKLQDVREWGGHTEIIAMARLFKWVYFSSVYRYTKKQNDDNNKLTNNNYL